jgi:hypothetical protein
MEYRGIYVVDHPALNDFLIAMLHHSPPSSKTYRFLYFREVLFHSRCQSRKRKREGLRFTARLRDNHGYAIDAVLVGIEIIEAVLKS